MNSIVRRIDARVSPAADHGAVDRLDTQRLESLLASAVALERNVLLDESRTRRSAGLQAKEMRISPPLQPGHQLLVPEIARVLPRR